MEHEVKMFLNHCLNLIQLCNMEAYLILYIIIGILIFVNTLYAYEKHCKKIKEPLYKKWNKYSRELFRLSWILLWPVVIIGFIILSILFIILKVIDKQ